MGEFKCRVCGEEFKNLLVHLRKDGEKLLKEENITELLNLENEYIKPDHLQEYKNINSAINWDLGGIRECFCGGEINLIKYHTEYCEIIKAICDRCYLSWGRIIKKRED